MPLESQNEVDTSSADNGGLPSLNAAVPNGNAVLRSLRRLLIFVTGFTVLLVGLAMIVLPGPAVVVIPAGLAILATEFLWARRILRRMKDFYDRARQRV